MTNEVLTKVQLFLDEASRVAGGKSNSTCSIPPAIIEEFKEACGHALERQFTQRKNEYRIRMSGVGKALCQQKLDYDPDVIPDVDYTLIKKFLFGDIIEAVAIAIMKSAGVEIQDEQKPVSLDIAGMTLKGTYDVRIDNKVYDIKSASPAAFSSKFGANGGYFSVKKNDPFGYIPQGYLYAKAAGVEFGGWIVINKATGEWAVCETPDIYDKDAEEAITLAETNIKEILSKSPFKRGFEDSAETYKDKEKKLKYTGNRLLPVDCSFCGYRKHCWPDSQWHSKVPSTAANPPSVWYSKMVREEL